MSLQQKTAQPAHSIKSEKSKTAIKIWLYCLAGLVFVMVLVGGATRLTDSGLSITEWRPILGIIPPLGQADWLLAFQKYQQIPEYDQVNRGMSLSEFKFIYWWEWGHRFLGRMIGFAFLIPFLFFWLSGRIEQKLAPRLLLLFVLGGLQGALGWFMVMSGLTDRVDVSQYRLAAHLGLAVVIFAAILWVAWGIKEGHAKQQDIKGEETSPFLVSLAWVLVGLVFLQILAGAFVAGTHAGLTYNTWPLMDGQFVPNGLWSLEPWYLNLFENLMTIQFSHRLIAYGIVVFAIFNLGWVLFKGQLVGSKGLAFTIVIVCVLQMVLGIVTLLAADADWLNDWFGVSEQNASFNRLVLALCHQGAALLVFGLALYQLWRHKGLSQPGSSQ